MVIRIFRVEINPELREEFESKFTSVSIDSVKHQKGFISVSIGKPTKWSPNEYVMVSKWDNEQSLETFIGKSWSQAHIPNGMEKFVNQCWVHHYNEY
jgi:heme-degrading monooxygenase HmoA